MDMHGRMVGISFFDTLKNRNRPADKPVMFDVWNHVMPNPCVGMIQGEGDNACLYSYNCTSDRDELYRLDDAGQIKNLFHTEQDLRKSAQRQMYEALRADPRWDVYNCYFKLEYGRELGLRPGDNQKFE